MSANTVASSERTCFAIHINTGVRFYSRAPSSEPELVQCVESYSVTFHTARQSVSISPWGQDLLQRVSFSVMLFFEIVDFILVFLVVLKRYTLSVLPVAKVLETISEHFSWARNTELGCRTFSEMSEKGRSWFTFTIVFRTFIKSVL